MVFLLVFPPLFFGAVNPGAAGIVIVVSFALGLIFLWQRTVAADLYRRESVLYTHRARIYKPLFVAAALILVYGLLVTVPLPSWFQGALSPDSLKLRQAAGEAVGTGNLLYPLSLDADSSVGALLILAACFIFFFVCLGGFPDWKKTRLAAGIFVALTFVVSLLGIMQALIGSERLLWSGLVKEGLKPFGPFVNRNHFASWAGMGAMLGTGYFFSMAQRRVKSRKNEYTENDRNIKAKRTLVGFMTAVTVAAIFLTLSRGGVISLIAGMIFFSLLLSRRRRLGRAWRVPGMLFVALLMVVWIGADPAIDRLGTIMHIRESQNVRIDINRDLIRMAGDFPWVGTGPGTFAVVYPSYQTVDKKGSYTFAHNDYFQLLSEWGAVGAGLFAVAVAAFWWKFLRMWSRRRDREILYISAGAAAGLVSVMTHSIVSFSLHIPAVALAFCFIGAFALKATDARTQMVKNGRNKSDSHV